VRLEQERAFLDRPEHRSGGLVAAYPHAQMGTLEQVGAFWNFADLPLRLDVAPPALGQHTAEILGELGYRRDQIAAWVESGVVAVDDRHAPQHMTQRGSAKRA
jgi:crotonobetainyl-CoA:carnitine CoA-transferase CaiB-like acyl-CoA transferase